MSAPSAVAKHINAMRLADQVVWDHLLHLITGQPVSFRSKGGPWRSRRGCLAAAGAEAMSVTVADRSMSLDRSSRWTVCLAAMIVEEGVAACLDIAPADSAQKGWPDCDAAQRSAIEVLAGYDEEFVFRVGNGFRLSDEGRLSAPTAWRLGQIARPDDLAAGRQDDGSAWVCPDQLAPVLGAYARCVQSLRQMKAQSWQPHGH